MKLWPLAALLLACGCAPAGGMAKPPELPADRYAKCSVKKSQARPLIVEWPSVDRAALESLSRRGLVAVRYGGCEMEVLSRCRVKGSYKYTPVTLQAERVTIKDADELYAQIPVGAAKLEGELAKSGQLEVDTSIVGTFDAESNALGRDDLEGECSTATHVLTTLTVGAFEFFSGAAVGAGAGGSALGVGAGGKTRSERSLLSRSGDAESCKRSARSDTSPPDGCGALIRVEATPLGVARSASPEPTSPPAAAPRGEPGPEPAPPAADAPAAIPAPGVVDTPTPPPIRGRVGYGPGFVLGLRGPFGIHFGALEDGASLHRYSLFSAGGVLEIGYRLTPALALAATGTLFSGSAGNVSDECPNGVKCRATIVGAGANLIVSPSGGEGFWVGGGASASWVITRREGTFDDAGTQHTLTTARTYSAVGPDVGLGVDFADSYVAWINYGFMLGYAFRKTLSASGSNQLDGQSLPLGNGDLGTTHTLLLVGRFHFDFGARELER